MTKQNLVVNEDPIATKQNMIAVVLVMIDMMTGMMTTMVAALVAVLERTVDL